MAGYVFVRRDEAVLVSVLNKELTIHPFPTAWRSFYNGDYFNVRAIVQRRNLNKEVNVFGQYLEKLTEFTPEGFEAGKIILESIMSLRDDHDKIYILTDRGVLTYGQQGNDHYMNGQAIMYWRLTENACIATDPVGAEILLRSLSACPHDEDIIDRVKAMNKLNLFGSTNGHIDNLYPRVRNEVEQS